MSSRDASYGRRTVARFLSRHRSHSDVRRRFLRRQRCIFVRLRAEQFLCVVRGDEFIYATGRQEQATRRHMETVAPDDGRTDSSVEDRYGWGKPATLESWLFAEGHRFDFFQA